MRVTMALSVLGIAALLGSAWPTASEARTFPGHRSPKQLNDPLPPSAMPQNVPSRATPTPRGTSEGMGNEVDLSKTPGDDDPSDGIDEPGRDPIPGQARPAPGVNKIPRH